MNSVRALSLGFLLLTATPGHAAGPPAFQAMWNAVARDPDCKPSPFPDFVVFSCKRQQTFWYFTKDNHPANPGIIKRFLVEQNGGWYLKEEGHSFGSDAAQPAFKAWLAQIADLDRQAREAINKQHNQKSVGHQN